MNWLNYAWQIAWNIRITSDFHLKIGRLEHYNDHGKVDYALSDVELTPSEVGEMIKMGFAQVVPH